MRWACSSRFGVVLMALCCAVLAACTDGATPAGTPQMTTPAAMPELITLAETQPYRERIAQGLGNISWASAYVSPTTQAAAQGEATARAAIQASAQPLAAVDYVALALPDWVTVTRKLQVAPGDFTGQGVTASEVGSVDGEPRWVLYEWRGPEIPQRDDRPIVYRWVYVYALYDVAESRVTRLLATIRGEVHE